MYVYKYIMYTCSSFYIITNLYQVFGWVERHITSRITKALTSEQRTVKNIKKKLQKLS